MKRVLFFCALSALLLIGCTDNPAAPLPQSKRGFIPIDNTWSFNPPDSATILLHLEYVPYGEPPPGDSVAIAVTYRDASEDSVTRPSNTPKMAFYIRSTHIDTVRAWQFH